jgi:hypothetical protein
MTGYSSFGIAGFSDSVDETYRPTDVHGLHRAPEWYRQDITLCRIRHLPVGAATAGWNTPDGMLAANGCDVVDGPIAGGIGTHLIERRDDRSVMLPIDKGFWR